MAPRCAVFWARSACGWLGILCVVRGALCCAMRDRRAPTNRRHCAGVRASDRSGDAVGSGIHTPTGLVFTVEDTNSGNRAAVSLSPLGIQNAVTAVAGYLDSTQHADLASAVRARGLYNKHGAALNRVGEIAAESLVFIGSQPTGGVLLGRWRCWSSYRPCTCAGVLIGQ